MTASSIRLTRAGYSGWRWPLSVRLSKCCQTKCFGRVLLRLPTRPMDAQGLRRLSQPSRLQRSTDRLPHAMVSSGFDLGSALSSTCEHKLICGQASELSSTCWWTRLSGRSNTCSGTALQRRERFTISGAVGLVGLREGLNAAIPLSGFDWAELQCTCMCCARQARALRCNDPSSGLMCRSKLNITPRRPEVVSRYAAPGCGEGGQYARRLQTVHA